jgi:hypothetical protein
MSSNALTYIKWDFQECELQDWQSHVHLNWCENPEVHEDCKQQEAWTKSKKEEEKDLSA